MTLAAPLSSFVSASRLWNSVLLAVVPAVFATASTANAGDVTASALFQLSSEEPTLLPAEPRHAGGQSFEIFKKTQLALLKSHFVLNAAVRAPHVASFSMLEGVEDPVEWLQGNLQAGFDHDSEILSISLRGNSDQADELRQLVDAVAKAYLDEVIYAQKQRALANRDLLARTLEQISKQIELKTEEQIDIARESGGLQSAAGRVLQELDMKRIDRTDAEILRLELALLEAQSASDAARSKLIEQRIVQLRERLADLEQRVVARAQDSVELEGRARELRRLRRLEDQLSMLVERMEIDANAPERVRQLQPAMIKAVR